MIWLLIGTIFYTLHDGLAWSKGFYRSVDAGWSMGWRKPDYFKGDAISKMYTVFHSTLGVVFMGVVIMYIAKRMAESGTSWSASLSHKGLVDGNVGKSGSLRNMLGSLSHLYDGDSDESDDDSDTMTHRVHPVAACLFRAICNKSRNDAICHHMSHFRLVYICLLLVVVGAVWRTVATPEWQGDVVGLDFTLSTMMGAGYIAIPEDSPSSYYLFVGVYTAVGVPLSAVAIGVYVWYLEACMLSAGMINRLTITDVVFFAGMVLSQWFATCEIGDVIGKITAEVTHEEVAFLRLTGIETDDGLLDHQAFLILTAIRMGAASPDLITEIINRFRELDRKKESKIAYDDLVVGRSKKSKHQKMLFSAIRSERFKQLVMSAKNIQVAPWNADEPEAALSSGDSNQQSVMTRSISASRSLVDKLLRPRSKSDQAISTASWDAGDVEGGKAPGNGMALVLEDADEEDGDRKSSSDDDSPAPTLQETSHKREPRMYVNPIRLIRVKQKLLARKPLRKHQVPKCGDSHTAEASPVAFPSQRHEVAAANGGGVSHVRKFSVDGGAAGESNDEHTEMAVPSIQRPTCATNRGRRFSWLPQGSTLATVVATRRQSWWVDATEPSSPTAPIDGHELSNGHRSSKSVVPPLTSVPSVILKLTKHNKLRSKYKLAKQVGSRFYINQIPATRWEMFIFLARAAINDQYVISFAAWYVGVALSYKHTCIIQTFTHTSLTRLSALRTLWIVMGCVFYACYEHRTPSGALYRSVSYGYGLFWVKIRESTVSALYARFQFILGLFAMNAVRALFAKKLVETDALW